jgi:outer membrane protein
MVPILAISCLITTAGRTAVVMAQDNPASVEAEVARTPMGWDQAIRSGLEHHPKIQISQSETLASQAVTGQLEAANYPRISGIYANSGGNTRVLANLGVSGSLPKPTNYLTTPGVRVDYLITDFGHTAHQILANKSLTAAAEKQTLTTKALVILRIQQAYLNCLKQQQLMKIAHQVLKERQLIRDQAETLHRHQLRSKLDLDFASVEVNRAELVLLKAQNDLQVAFAGLNNAMGGQVAEEYALQDIAIDLTPVAPLNTLFEQALAQRPELLGSKDRLQAAEEALQSARALHFGNVTAIGTAAYTLWSREETTSPKGNPNNPGAKLGWYGAGVTSAFPIYTGGRISGQVEEVEARKGEVEATTRALANDVVLQVAQAYLVRLSAEQQIKAAREKLDHAREALSLARERYKAGLGSILELTTSTANLLSAEGGLAEAQYEFRGSDAALAYATGSEIARYQ